MGLSNLQLTEDFNVGPQKSIMGTDVKVYSRLSFPWLEVFFFFFLSS